MIKKLDSCRRNEALFLKLQNQCVFSVMSNEFLGVVEDDQTRPNGYIVLPC